MSCKCLGGSKFVVIFFHELYLHFYHHYLFLSHCCLILFESSFVSNIWQTIISKKIKDYEEKEPYEEDDFARERRAMRGQDYDNSDSVSANVNIEALASDERNVINSVKGMDKLFLRTLSSFFLQFSKEMIQLANYIICFLSHTSAKTSLLIYNRLQSMLGNKDCIGGEYRVKEEMIEESSHTEDTSIVGVQNIFRESLKNISLEAVNFTKQFSLEVVSHLKQTSNFFIWFGPFVASESYVMLVSKAPAARQMTSSCITQASSFSKVFVRDLVIHVQDLGRIIIFFSSVVVNISIKTSKIALESLKRSKGSEGRQSNVEPNNDPDIFEHITKKEYDHHSNDANKIIQDEYTIHQDVVSSDQPSNFKAEDRNECLYEYVKDAVEESAQSLASSMNESVMEFTRNAIDSSSVEEKQEERKEIDTSSTNAPVQRPLSRASMSARLEMLSESPPPSPTLDSLITEHDDFVPFRASFRQRKRVSRPSLLKSSSSETDDLDNEKTTSLAKSKSLQTYDEEHQEASMEQNILEESTEILALNSKGESSELKSKSFLVDDEKAVDCFQTDHVMSEETPKSPTEEISLGDKFNFKREEMAIKSQEHESKRAMEQATLSLDLSGDNAVSIPSKQGFDNSTNELSEIKIESNENEKNIQAQLIEKPKSALNRSVKSFEDDFIITIGDANEEENFGIFGTEDISLEKHY